MSVLIKEFWFLIHWIVTTAFANDFLYLMFITFNLIPKINRSKLGYTATSPVIM